MRKLLSKVKLTHKINALLLCAIVIVSCAVGVRLLGYFEGWVKDEVLQAQNLNILVASSVVENEQDIFKIENRHSLEEMRFVFSALPEFENHDMIDEVGRITQETATIFLWDDETEDFWRKTTNIKKDDGSRAVGTPLGKDGAVYPYMIKGENFVGEAVILGKPYYTRYDPIFKEGTKEVVGILYVGVEKNKFDAIQQDVTNTIVVISILSTLFVFIVSAVLLRTTVSGPLKKIISQMHALSKGQYDFKVYGEDRGDELGDVARAISVFKQNAFEIKRMQEQSRVAEEKAEEEKRQMMADVASDFDNKVRSLIVELSDSSSTLNQTAQKMRQIAENTSQSSEAVAKTSDEVGMNVNTVAAAIEEMSATASEISSQMHSVKIKSDDTARNAQSANEAVGDLDQLAKNIGEVVVSIQDIAEQTNLLALNATIEAARAGEAGKGFAVVADEVKKLATETAKKTEEISDRISEIQNATDNSVDAMVKIIHSVEEIDEAITAVSSAVEEQNTTTGEIVRSVSDASQAVQGVSTSIRTVQSAASEAGISADEVLSSAENVSGLSDNIRKSVDDFLKQISQ